MGREAYKSNIYMKGETKIKITKYNTGQESQWRSSNEIIWSNMAKGQGQVLQVKYSLTCFLNKWREGKLQMGSGREFQNEVPLYRMVFLTILVEEWVTWILLERRVL